MPTNHPDDALLTPSEVASDIRGDPPWHVAVFDAATDPRTAAGPELSARLLGYRQR